MAKRMILKSKAERLKRRRAGFKKGGLVSPHLTVKDRVEAMLKRVGLK